MKKSQEKRAGSRRADGNITIDLGESIEKKLAAAGMSGAKRAGAARKGEYRPGMFGYRPFYASPRPSLGAKLGLPETVNVSQALTGALVGTLGNRVLRWVVPGILGSGSALTVNAVNFGVGLVPFLAQRNSMTLGIAIPGLVYLAGSLADWAIEKTNILGAPPALRGSGRLSSADAQTAARQKLADIQQRLAQRQAAVQRVQAQPRFVG